MFNIQTTARFEKDCKKQGKDMEKISKGMKKLEKLEWLSRKDNAPSVRGEFHMSADCILTYRVTGDSLCFQRIISGPNVSETHKYVNHSKTFR